MGSPGERESATGHPIQRTALAFWAVFSTVVLIMLSHLVSQLRISVNKSHAICWPFLTFLT
jgi:hypothetical protein